MKEVLRRLLAGELTLAEAELELGRVQLEELDGRARLDIGRSRRRGLPEVILASGKEPADVARLLAALAAEQGQALASRLGPEHWRAVEAGSGDLQLVRYSSSLRALRPGFSVQPRGGRVAVVTAGTSDLPAAQEAVMMVEACGHQARLECDLGVAGLHRLLGPLAELVAWNADVLVVAAGMDGVLPGVVAGLVDQPVIGLPTSIGYGAGGQGWAALLTMLQSCATGLTVVNIDNGIGAGAAATLIASRAAGATPTPPTRSRPESRPRSPRTAPSRTSG